jgi:hypothetical protein
MSMLFGIDAAIRLASPSTNGNPASIRSFGATLVLSCCMKPSIGHNAKLNSATKHGQTPAPIYKESNCRTNFEEKIKRRYIEQPLL